MGRDPRSESVEKNVWPITPPFLHEERFFFLQAKIAIILGMKKYSAKIWGRGGGGEKKSLIFWTGRRSTRKWTSIKAVCRHDNHLRPEVESALIFTSYVFATVISFPFTLFSNISRSRRSADKNETTYGLGRKPRGEGKPLSWRGKSKRGRTSYERIRVISRAIGQCVSCLMCEIRS